MRGYKCASWLTQFLFNSDNKLRLYLFTKYNGDTAGYTKYMYVDTQLVTSVLRWAQIYLPYCWLQYSSALHFS